MSPLVRNNVEVAPMPPGLQFLLWRYLAALERGEDASWAYADLYHTLTPHFRVRFRGGGYEVAQVHADKSRDLRTLRIRQYR